MCSNTKLSLLKTTAHTIKSYYANYTDIATTAAHFFMLSLSTILQALHTFLIITALVLNGLCQLILTVILSFNP